MIKGIIAAIFLLLVMVPVRALNPYGFETFINLGHVYARSAVTTEGGGPVWAEYNENGGYSRIPSLDDMEGKVIAKAQLRELNEVFNDFKSRNGGQLEYLTPQDLQAPDFELLTADDRKILGLPYIPGDAAIIAFPPKDRRLTTSGPNIEHYAFPIDIRILPSVFDGEGSVFFDSAGTYKYDSTGRIGPMTAYYRKNGETYPGSSSEYSDNTPLGSSGIFGQDVELLNPIYGAFLETPTGYIDPVAYTDAEGAFRLRGAMSPCPGFAYSQDYDTYLRLNYSTFSPRSRPTIPYYMTKTSYNNCMGYGARQPDNSLAGLMAQTTVIGIIAGTPENITTQNFAVAVSVLAGKAFLPPSVLVGEQTLYEADASDEQLYMVEDDYDGDGTLDTVARGKIDESGSFVADPEGEIYGVFFSGSSNPGQPDITRVMDVIPNLSSEGLLSSISLSDLEKTDIYVFRESTGQLITERKGLKDFDAGSTGRSEAENDFFHFTIPVRGPEDQFSTYGRRAGGFANWQAKNKMNPDLQRFEADHLRPGEALRVIAINRPTGYIGSVRAIMTPPTVGGYIGVFIPAILMGPPNLKVWATRQYKPQGLLANSDTERRMVSNGGAATTDDHLVEVHTEWRDHTGYPLPVGLTGYGYTGRLTKQIGEGGTFDNAAQEFEINPGRQMQVLKFSGEAPQHYYLQVNGYPIGDQNDFSSYSQGDQIGALIHRPSRYVPVKVPLYFEQGTINDRLAIRNSDSENIDEYDVPAQFYWVYRPELSFSTVDLLVSEINEKDEEQGTAINLLDAATPVISSLADFVKVLFELVGSEYERITSFDGEQEFVFALGAQEVKVDINKNAQGSQQISFSNLEHLSSLEVEDFLTMSLYLNHDSQNTLWEWGFENLIVTSRDADNDLETDDTYYVSADDPVVPMIAILSGYSDRDPALKKPMILRWKSDNGDLSVQQEVNDTTGIFKTELTMPVQAGSRATLTAELEGSENAIEFKAIEVVPGAPAHIAYRKTTGGDSIGVLGTASQQYEITVTDSHGNIVQDGTSVTYSLEGYATVTEEDTGTTSGKAYVTVTGTERYDDAIKLTVVSGAASQTIPLVSPSLDVSMESAEQMVVGETQQVTLRVVNPAGITEGLEATISSPYLGVEEQSIVLDSLGRATVTLMAPRVPVETYIHARIGYAGSARQDISVVEPDANIVADNYRPLLGESAQSGSYTYNRFDGSQIDFGYEVEKNITLKGTAGEIISAQLGDAYYPNQMPLMALALDASSIQTFSAESPTDDTGTYALTATGVSLDNSTLYGVGSSTRFNSSASIISDAASMAAVQRPGWALAIRPEQAGTLINLGGGQSLSVAANELVFRITTSDGFFQARAPIAMGEWHRVAARVTDTQLELYVNNFNTPVTSPYSGSLISSSEELTIGATYTGLMQGLRFYDGQSQPLLAINNGGSSADIQADASGNVSLTVNSLGNLNTNGQSLDLTYVHLVHNGERVHIPVVSEQGFKQITANAANIGLAGPPLAFNSNPDYNITDPWAPRNLPFSSVMPQAQAFGWLDALDFIIPVSSIITITEQIGRIGTEEFDPVALIIAGLDVALVFSGPLRGPLKLAFDPLAKLISNPATQKLAKVLGPFFGNVIEKVAKSRSIDPILNLLPFLMIVGEIAADEEAREAIPIIFDAISSSEDLQVWFDYFNLPDDGWEGDIQPLLDLELASLDSSALPLGMLVPQAYAAGGPKRISGAVASKKIRLAMKGLATGRIDTQTAAASITRSMAIIIKEGKDNAGIRKILTDPKTLKAGATMVVYGGVRYFQNLLRGRNGNEPSRTPVFLQLAAIAYLESNIGCDGPQCWDVNEPIVPKLRLLYSKAFADAVVGEYGGSFTSGYRFHLVMTALLHAWGTTNTSPYGELIDIEAKRGVFLQSKKNGKWVPRQETDERLADFDRFVDIVTQVSTEDRPRLIELKSYKGRSGSGGNLTPVSDSTLKKRFPNWNMDKGEQGNHKQFILDRILATDNELVTDDNVRKSLYKAKEVHWMFQKFKLKTTGSLTEDQLKTVRKLLARNAKGSPDQVEASLGYSGSYSTSKSHKDADKIVKLFGIKSALGDAQSALVNKLFDLGNLSDEDKEKLKAKITEMVLDRLDESD